MKSKSFKFDFLIIVYVILFFLVLGLNFAGFEWISRPFRIMSYIIYLSLACFAMYSLYKTQTKNIRYVAVPVLSVLFLISIGSPLLEFPILMLFIVIFLSEYSTILKGVFLFFITIIICLAIFITLLGDFGLNKTLTTLPSPNNKYELLVVDSDQGALGGETFVELNRVYFGLYKKHCRDIYVGPWGDLPFVKWLDNETASLNGRRVNVFKDPIWDLHK